MRAFLVIVFLSMSAAESLRCDDTALDSNIKQQLAESLRDSFSLDFQLMAFETRFHRNPANAKEFLDFAGPHQGFDPARFPNLVLTPKANGGIAYSYDDLITHKKSTGSSGPISHSGRKTKSQ